MCVSAWDWPARNLYSLQAPPGPAAEKAYGWLPLLAAIISSRSSRERARTGAVFGSISALSSFERTACRALLV